MNMHVATPRPAVNARTLPHVRLATEDDFEEIMDLGRELWRENGLMQFDEEKVSHFALNALRGKDGIIGVIGKNPIEGFILLCLRQLWYAKDGDVHLEEFTSYVKPEFRKSQNAIALIEFAKDAAIKLNVPLWIGILSNARTEQKIRLYRRRLGDMAGAYFLFHGKTGHQGE